MVILTPILIILAFLGVQTAIYFHAANVAAAAASQGAAAAAPNIRSNITSNNAVAAAERTVFELGGHNARPPSVTVDGSFVTVSVEVKVPRILPFFPSTVTRRALEPRERFVPESNR